MRLRNLLSLMTLVAVMIFMPVFVYSGTVSLPKTGQTQSYYTGDDGDLQKGVTWPTPRFTDNGDGTITDNLTGLMWTQNANPAGSTLNWYEALTYVNSLSFANHSDWRMPNIVELESLIHSGQANQKTWLESQGFTNVMAGDNTVYWVSTAYVNYTGGAWGIRMTDGSYYAFHGDFGTSKSDTIMNSNNNDISVQTYVWPVRCANSSDNDPGDACTGGTISLPKTGQAESEATGDDGDLQMGVAWPTPRFTDNGDGTITDNLTGFMWLKDTNCMATQGIDADGKVTWYTALDFITEMNDGTYSNCNAGYTDWRLPNRKELLSVEKWIGDQGITCGPSDNCMHDLWFAAEGFTNPGIWGRYWTSTTSAELSDKAFITWLAVGMVERGMGNTVKNPNGGVPGGAAGTGFDKSTDGWFLVWPVRTIQYDLTVSVSPSVGGTVTSSPSGINCPGDCTESYYDGTSVTLTANPNTVDGYVFTGWAGACSGTETTCDILINEAKSVTANFTILGTPDIAVVPTDLTVDFGGVNLFSSSDTTITVSNDGDLDLNIGTITGPSSPFSIVSDTCSDTTLSPTESCTITLRFSPETSGSFNSSLNIPSNDPDENPVVIDLTGTGISQGADITVEPVTIAFGSMNLSLSRDVTITVRNDGDLDLNIDTITGPSSPFSKVSDTCSGNNLARFASCQIRVRFSPETSGSFNSSLNIPSNDPDENPVTVALTGRGVSGTGPDIGVSTNEMSDFLNTALNSTSDGTLRIYNDGSAGLSIEAITIAGSDSDKFTINQDNCSGQTITSYCDVVVRLRAQSQAGGPFIAHLLISSNDSDEGIVKVGLIGSTIETGNTAPTTKPTLQSPANGATTSQITFAWTDAEDPSSDDAVDGGVLNHRLYYGTDPSFVGATVLPGQTAFLGTGSEVRYAMVLGDSVVIMVLFGVSVIGGFLLRKKARFLIMFLIVMVVFTGGLFLNSCGGGGTSVEYGTSEVQAGTYYWKVVADDGKGGVTQSDTYSFTVGE
jgi:uncharacterized repeat protein (TIGR02543 family)